MAMQYAKCKIKIVRPTARTIETQNFLPICCFYFLLVQGEYSCHFPHCVVKTLRGGRSAAEVDDVVLCR